MDAILYSSRSEEWATPQGFFDALNAEFSFDLDAAASDANAKCERYFTEKDNGLTKQWDGKAVWLNPPYGRAIGEWMKTACWFGTFTRVICLVPARTDTDWFHSYVWGQAAELRFVRGRLRFGGGQNSATFPSVVVVYDHDEGVSCRVSTIDRDGQRIWKQKKESHGL